MDPKESRRPLCQDRRAASSTSLQPHFTLAHSLHTIAFSITFGVIFDFAFDVNGFELAHVSVRQLSELAEVALLPPQRDLEDSREVGLQNDGDHSRVGPLTGVNGHSLLGVEVFGVASVVDMISIGRKSGPSWVSTFAAA